MDIIPGMDLLDGQCVCTVHMPFSEHCHLPHDPAEVAKMWADQGAPRLYLADLDGARMGQPMNLKAVEQIIKGAKIPVDLGGGIRTVETAKRVLDMGVDRVIVGTTAALEDGLAKEIFSSVGDRVVLSIASLNGFVAVRDWQARTDERAEHFASRMRSLGARRIVYTDVSRKGMHGGVNITAVRRIAQALDIPVIASGGVANLDDIKDLKALEPYGVEGIVVVTAIYSGTIKLADAISLCQS